MVRIVVIAAALVAATAVAASAARPSLTVTPSSVRRGHLVLLKGSADGCHTGDTVVLLSRAFVHTHDFASVPAVWARVRTGGLFSVTTRIPVTKPPGRYTVTGRCGGGNLGFIKYLTVLR
jgi:hypothetical protein